MPLICLPLFFSNTLSLLPHTLLQSSLLVLLLNEVAFYSLVHQVCVPLQPYLVPLKLIETAILSFRCHFLTRVFVDLLCIILFHQSEADNQKTVFFLSLFGSYVKLSGLDYAILRTCGLFAIAVPQYLLKTAPLMQSYHQIAHAFRLDC